MLEELDIVTVDDKKILFKKDLEKSFSDVLKKTDYVHTSEFLTEAEKTEILGYRQVLKQQYETRKTDIYNATTMAELCSISLKIEG